MCLTKGCCIIIAHANDVELCATMLCDETPPFNATAAHVNDAMNMCVALKLCLGPSLHEHLHNGLSQGSSATSYEPHCLAKFWILKVARFSGIDIRFMNHCQVLVTAASACL